MSNEGEPPDNDDGVDEEELTQGLDDIDQEMIDAMNSAQEGRTVSGPEDLQGESGRFFEAVVPTGEIWQEDLTDEKGNVIAARKGEHKLVEFEGRIPDAALELVGDYMENIGDPESELLLWDHFDIKPEWLLDEKRHGLFRDDKGNLFPRKDNGGSLTDKYLETFDEDERREHDDIVFSEGMKRRITLKILDKSPADGDFFAERLGMVPSDVIKSVGRIHSESQQNSESDHSASKGGAPASGQSSPATSTEGTSDDDSSGPKIQRGEPRQHGTRID